MDNITKQLQSFLVQLHYQPEQVSEKMVHYAEHLLHLLPADHEQMLKTYFGLFGTNQQALADIAHQHHLEPESCMELIDSNLHKLAISPEWQLMNQIIQSKKS